MTADKWEKLKRYCKGKIAEAESLSPSFTKRGQTQLRNECAYMMKHYSDVLLRMEELEGSK